ncbi:hypothetical protein EUA51_05145 [Staphylococcus saprophyticus]|nr:hypothetical protein ASS91_05130 [Staphylococcus saprophyticus]OEK50119.1 hypothetical protein ASS93_01520 [Staphylococcus saprophyticus]RXS21136.1 hypothetical protein EUA51_05145 [Staphylococcus saprophyticus]
MRKFNVNASLLMDSLLSFSIITLICILFIPMILQLKLDIQHKSHEIDLTRILLNSLYQYKRQELKSGIMIEDYSVKMSNDKICIFKKGETYEKCFFK